MPELPEVEAVRTGLEQLVLAKEIEKVTVLWGSIIESPEPALFEVNLIGEKIEKISRRGKYLIFSLTNYDLISHLRMEGKYEFHRKEEEISKHTHVVFSFTDDTDLRYLDVRKFGKMSLIPKGTALNFKGLKTLGPEPVSSTFKLDQFEAGLRKYARAIKPILMEQKLVAGLGNIYTDEVLYQACINPEQPASTLNSEEVERLYHAIIAVLAEAVEAGGTTIRTYKNALGEAGKFQVALKVYGQKGAICERCGSRIKKIKVAQRGTHYCPTCQKLRKRKIKY